MGKAGWGRSTLFRRALPALAAGVLVVVLAPGAGSHQTGGSPWPTKTITYANQAKGYAWSVNQAVRAWNASGADIKLVPAPLRRARLVIRYGSGVPGEIGTATVGFIRGKAEVRLVRGYDRLTMAYGAAHELGHVLGLAHEEGRCVVMSAVLRPECVQPRCPEPWRCLLHEDDVAGAQALYGPRAAERSSP